MAGPPSSPVAVTLSHHPSFVDEGHPQDSELFLLHPDPILPRCTGRAPLLHSRGLIILMGGIFIFNMELFLGKKNLAGEDQKKEEELTVKANKASSSGRKTIHNSQIQP